MQVVSLDVAVLAEATCERAVNRALGIRRKRPEPPDPVRLCGWLRLDLDRTRRSETNGEDEGYAAKPHDPPPEEINGLILVPSCGQPRYVEAGRSCKPFAAGYSPSKRLTARGTDGSMASRVLGPRGL